MLDTGKGDQYLLATDPNLDRFSCYDTPSYEFNDDEMRGIRNHTLSGMLLSSVEFLEHLDYIILRLEEGVHLALQIEREDLTSLYLSRYVYVFGSALCKSIVVSQPSFVLRVYFRVNVRLLPFRRNETPEPP